MLVIRMARHVLRRGADKSLARPTSRCYRTESIVSERGVCSCAELQVFYCYRGRKEACQATCAISTTSRCELSSIFFFAVMQAAEEIHAILTETLGERATSYATVKKWVAQFKRGDFSTCDAPCPGRPKTVTTPDITDQIHELILDDRRISAKSIAKQLSISRERVGSIIHEDLDVRKLSAKWVPKCLNADQKHQLCQSSEQLLEFFRRDPNGFLSRLVTNGRNLVISLWPGDKAKIKGVAAYRLTTPQRIPSAKVRWKSSRLDFLGSRRHLPHLLFSKRPNYQRGVLLISAGAIEGHFEGKTQAAGRSPNGSWSCTTMPRAPGTCNPEETGLSGLLISWSPTLFSGSGPVGLPPVPWTEKTFGRSPFFFRCGGQCCRGELVGRTTFWTFFWVACKS